MLSQKSNLIIEEKLPLFIILNSDSIKMSGLSDISRETEFRSSITSHEVPSMVLYSHYELYITSKPRIRPILLFQSVLFGPHLYNKLKRKRDQIILLKRFTFTIIKNKKRFPFGNLFDNIIIFMG